MGQGQMINLETKIGKLVLKNPIILASGTCGYGDAYQRFYSVAKLGAVVTKGISLKPRSGNPPPRIYETYAGLLNSIGLENIGVEKFISEKIPKLKKLKASVIVNIFGESEQEYVELAKILNAQEGISALELNLSCPNVKKGGLEFGRDPETVESITREIKANCALPVWVKLSASRSDPVELATSAEKAGADAIVVSNTLKAMAIELETKKPALGAITGGISGPGIKPVALASVFELVKAVKIPVVGCGGIFSGRDVLEFLLVGASAVEIGTACLINPRAPIEILNELKEYLKAQKISSITDWIGSIRLDD